MSYWKPAVTRDMASASQDCPARHRSCLVLAHASTTITWPSQSKMHLLLLLSMHDVMCPLICCTYVTGFQQSSPRRLSYLVEPYRMLKAVATATHSKSSWEAQEEQQHRGS